MAWPAPRSGWVWPGRSSPRPPPDSRHIFLFSFGWRPAFLLGTALAPTDPAVVFSVLGQRQVSGRSGVLIKGESGANDPYKREIARFHSALASLAELTAFVLLGLTVNLASVGRHWAWLTGLLLAALLAFAIRPLLVGLLLLPVRLRPTERLFILWAGLKGAVPILLGSVIVDSGTTGAARIYSIIFVAVAFSVLAQGSTVPAVARRLKIPMTAAAVEPWTIGLRLRQEPEGFTGCASGPAAAPTKPPSQT